MTKALILLVSRDTAAPFPEWNGEGNPWRVELADSGWQALERVQSRDYPDLILLDLGENAADGLHTLRWLRRIRPDIPVVLLSQSEDMLQRTEALRLGAKDYLVKPIQEANLLSLIERHTDQPQKRADFAVSSENIEQVAEDVVFVSASPAMRELRAQADLLSQIDAPLLIVGQSDSGKQVAARLIHKLSVRSGFQFLRVNCSALPADLLESELFGKDRAVVAGRPSSLPGKLDLCQKGTVYFDEITALPPSLQEKVVRLLQDKTFSRVGGDARVESDFRVIAATQVNIEEALAEGKLREDLYFRLSAFTVYVPPLRQRREDISLLLVQFMSQLARHYDLPARTFSTAVLSACRHYTWPGNLKELENFAKRFLVVGDEELAITELERKLAIAAEPLAAPAKLELVPDPSRPSLESKESSFGLKSLVQSIKGEAERNAIVTALEQTHWNRKAASRVLQVSYRTLLYKIQHYHLTPPSNYLSSVLVGQGIKSNGQ
ncbi:MAG: sigma-54-dependent transcriptional regulator [Terriglobales bacterium]